MKIVRVDREFWFPNIVPTVDIHRGQVQDMYVETPNIDLADTQRPPEPCLMKRVTWTRCEDHHAKVPPLDCDYCTSRSDEALEAAYSDIFRRKPDVSVHLEEVWVDLSRVRDAESTFEMRVCRMAKKLWRSQHRMEIKPGKEYYVRLSIRERDSI